jgi:hypothetical protein
LLSYTTERYEDVTVACCEHLPPYLPPARPPPARPRAFNRPIALSIHTMRRSLPANANRPRRTAPLTSGHVRSCPPTCGHHFANHLPPPLPMPERMIYTHSRCRRMPSAARTASATSTAASDCTRSFPMLSCRKYFRHERHAHPSRCHSLLCLLRPEPAKSCCRRHAPKNSVALCGIPSPAPSYTLRASWQVRDDILG